MFASIESFEKTLRDDALPDAVVAFLRQHIERAFVFKSGHTKVPLKRSRLGGYPHLPADAPWPMRQAYSDAERRREAHLRVAERYTNDCPPYMKQEACKRIAQNAKVLALSVSQEAPLNFVAQVFLADLKGEVTQGDLLPSTGTLSLYYDFGEYSWGIRPSDQEGFALVYHDDEGELRENKSLKTDESDSLLPVLPALKWVPQTCWTVPDLHALCWRASDESGITPDDLLRYHEWFQTHSMGDAEGDARDHRVLTWPSSIQDDMPTRAWLNARGEPFRILSDNEREAFAHEIREWVCVMQVGSDEKADLAWVDDGQLYVWMTQDALKRRAFDQAFFSLQSH